MKDSWYAEKFDWERMKEVYPQLDVDYLKTGCGNIEVFLSELGKSGIKYKGELYLICDSCGGAYTIEKRKFRGRLLKFIRGEDTYFVDFQTCQEKICKRDKQNKINKHRQEIGDSPATGHVVTEEQKEKWRKTAKKNGKVNRIWEWRKGKSLEEMYGKERGSTLKEKLRQARLNQEVDPRLGKKHSEESKTKMRESRNRFLSNNSDWLKESPITGELVDFKTYSSHIHSHVWHSLTQEEREERSKAVSEAHLKNFSDKDRHGVRGYHTAWWQRPGNKDQAYMSAYEVKYYTILDDKMVYYKNNTHILIPYLHPIAKEIRYYSPDVIIYGNNKFSEIKEIVEVKPYEFAVNPKGRSSDYYLVTEAKIEALEEYCKQKNYVFRVVTERDLGYNKSMEITNWFKEEYNATENSKYKEQKMF